MDRDVNGKVVAVTGSADGIGLAMLNSFLKHGAKLVICLDINETQGKKSVDKLNQEYGEKAVFYKCNVVTDLDALYDTITKNHEKVEIFINNAGIGDEISAKRIIEVNTIAVMEWSMKFYDYMRRDRGGNGGTIINVSSEFGYKIVPYVPFYHASKFAVIGFSRSLGHEVNFKNTGVRILTICPGLTRTNIIENPVIREDEMLPKFVALFQAIERQDPDNVGECTVEIFRIADSGTVWVAKNSKPAEKLDM